MPHAYMTKLKLDEAELRSRRAYFELTDEDLARLVGLRAFALKHDQAITDDFYQLILHHDESRRFFPDDATVKRVKELQKQYFLGLFAGRVDLAYVEDRLRVGVAHERIGMPPKFYLGSYARYLRLIREYLQRDLEPKAAAEAFTSVQKLVFFDMSLAIDTYVAASMETLARHQQAIRELSTPIIRVHERVLLMPLVGTIDTQRAQQVMETLLIRVIEDKAKVVILDIAGVPVVDTRVADHLLQTNSAVRLLGAQTIITGISGTVARTLVQLGVDVSNVQTQSQLTDGIERALAIVGKQIRDVA
jgi:rsbT co-antagonist protein RsbR